MSAVTGTLPAEVLAALDRGQTIEAVKQLRSSTGISLKEAKNAIDNYLDGKSVSIHPKNQASTLPSSVEDALQRGNKIEAIRILREQTGLGLKEAKEAVEAMPHQALSNIPSYKVADGAGKGWVFVLVILGMFGYFLLYKS